MTSGLSQQPRNNLWPWPITSQCPRFLPNNRQMTSGLGRISDTGGAGDRVGTAEGGTSDLREAGFPYRVTSFIRKRTLLGPYFSLCIGSSGGPGGGEVLLSEVTVSVHSSWESIISYPKVACDVL